ncbi:MAG: hypothetical protein E6G67_09965 [Actinobacteria bacterium]|nr:MAG: hypothetical protein E6G67_09965 [Actinomycetota bacterium]
MLNGSAQSAQTSQTNSNPSNRSANVPLAARVRTTTNGATSRSRGRTSSQRSRRNDWLASAFSAGPIRSAVDARCAGFTNADAGCLLGTWWRAIHTYHGTIVATATPRPAVTSRRPRRRRYVAIPSARKKAAANPSASRFVASAAARNRTASASQRGSASSTNRHAASAPSVKNVASTRSPAARSSCRSTAGAAATMSNAGQSSTGCTRSRRIWATAATKPASRSQNWRWSSPVAMPRMKWKSIASTAGTRSG